MDLITIVLVILALAIGAVVSWALTRGKYLGELASARASAAAASSRSKEIVADYSTRLADQHEMHKQRLEELKNDQQRLSQAFDSLAAQALERNSRAFLATAEQRFQRAHETNVSELQKREHAVKSLVEPLTKSLEGVREHMTAAEQARAQAHGALEEQVKAMALTSDSLRTETAQLTSALRASHVRGHWGEVQLRRVVEVAGMVEHVDFDEQFTIQSDQETLRPDMVVHLPGEKKVIVDAKVSLSAFLDAAESDDDQVRAKRFEAHARHVRTHVKSLGDKSYWASLPQAPEFVVMFIPSDAMLSAALDQDPQLLEDGFASNVIIATPATLVALLRTVAYTWRQERLAEDAAQVFSTGRELHRRLGTFGRHLEDLGKRLNDAVSSFNRLNRSIDSMLVPQAKRFAELQSLEEPFDTKGPIETVAIAAKKPELFTPRDDSAPGANR